MTLCSFVTFNYQLQDVEDLLAMLNSNGCWKVVEVSESQLYTLLDIGHFAYEVKPMFVCDQDELTDLTSETEPTVNRFKNKRISESIDDVNDKEDLPRLSMIVDVNDISDLIGVVDDDGEIEKKDDDTKDAPLENDRVTKNSVCKSCSKVSNSNDLSF